jgi:hypothetical protein
MMTSRSPNRLKSPNLLVETALRVVGIIPLWVVGIVPVVEIVPVRVVEIVPVLVVEIIPPFGKAKLDIDNINSTEQRVHFRLFMILSWLLNFKVWSVSFCR